MEDQTPEDQMQAIAAAILFVQMKIMVDRDIPPAKALRAVAVEILQSQYGSDVWKELGVATRTIERWRSELRHALAAAPDIEDQMPASVQEAFERLTAKKAG